MQTGYARGYLLNLLCHLKTDLRGFDFSHFAIHQAYLADTVLHNADFTDAPISQTLFAEADYTIKLWDLQEKKCWQALRVPRLYEDMKIEGIQGLTAAQWATLKALGAAPPAKRLFYQISFYPDNKQFKIQNGQT